MVLTVADQWEITVAVEEVYCYGGRVVRGPRR